MKFKATVFTLAMFVFATTASAQQKYDIKLNLKKDVTLLQKTSTNNKMEISQMGQNIPIYIENHAEATFKITPLKEGNYRVTYTLDKSMMTQDISQAGGEKIEISSEDPEDEYNKVLKASVNYPITYVINSVGEYEGTPDFTKYIKRVQEASQNAVSIEEIALSVCEFGKFYPLHPVKIGDSWEKSIGEAKLKFANNEKSFDADTKSTFTLKDVTDDCYIIESKNEIKFDIEGIDVLLKGVQILYVDKTTGLPVSYDLTVTGEKEVRPGITLRCSEKIETKYEIK